ncbi:hypothetical protein GCM10017744_038970 [Streptomyces antimycoticus]|uniref:Uncharacterized protein n=1 Tax=Streptomyces antimycoticus TaxID=68175 RepID=A0A4D4KFW1_9ACTN|nr:hypothetical protein SANT12839_063600 [Streptomyces antimycoticus]
MDEQGAGRLRDDAAVDRDRDVLGAALHIYAVSAGAGGLWVGSGGGHLFLASSVCGSVPGGWDTFRVSPGWGGAFRVRVTPSGVFRVAPSGVFRVAPSGVSRLLPGVTGVMSPVWGNVLGAAVIPEALRVIPEGVTPRPTRGARPGPPGAPPRG